MAKNYLLSKKVKLSLTSLIVLGAVAVVIPQPAQAAHVVNVTNTRVRQYWNTNNNNSFIQEWYSYRDLRVTNGYQFTGYSELKPYYHGLVVDRGVYFNYRTW
ncbi:hypothetical protein [Lactococcus lactis]|uniref:Lactococcin 972 family bacteriocin n=1 Tax=Lactococcus lactis subsp. lactis A12 TaxID=1137134 RepID=S6FV86_LACLL|nr:hypothetical protein [Lactococcus lactis]CDG05662.1 Putative uncharacterized protein [Lactococcus lactis subsp. lactis A12]SBW31763.1 Hypothetical protein LLA12_02640 [Lactococcus lactis subsp. lactis]